MTARSLWLDEKNTFAMLRSMGASKLVAIALQGRQYDALPRWVKTHLRRSARRLRSGSWRGE